MRQTFHQVRPSVMYPAGGFERMVDVRLVELPLYGN